MVMFSDPQLREVAECNGMTTDQKVFLLVQSGHLGPAVIPDKTSSPVGVRPSVFIRLLASIVSSVVWPLRSVQSKTDRRLWPPKFDTRG